uniref:Putative ovule protein n=1 Tax=Solanum chacoense TaxID=4108 RepID=A0A0V0HI06_SOLCH
MLKQWNGSLRCFGRLQKQGGTTVRRWRKKDVFSEIYCARNYNKYGRYISLINVKGRRRAMIIISKLTLNSG